MKRLFFVILFIMVLATPFALRLAMGWNAQPRAASDALELVILTPHAESIKREFADAFSQWHREKFGQPVDVDYRALSGNDIVRYLSAGRETVYAKLGTYKVDLAWGGGDVLFDRDLRPFLEPVKLDESILRAAFPQRELSGLPLYDTANPPAWFGTALSSFGIVYNKDVLARIGLAEPKTWSDLRDPRYRGWIVLADPTRSAVAKSVFMIIVERAMADAAQRGQTEDAGWAEGMGLIRQIAANARLFHDQGTAVPGWVASGDVAAGTAIDFQARFQVDAVGESRLGYVEPVGATSITPDPVAMLKGAPHREVATRFIEFLLSERGQRLWITRAGAPGGPKQTSLRRMPIMRSVYDRPTDFTDNVNPFAAAAHFNASAARRLTFPILGDLIEASCMEPLEELREARQAILASSEAEKLDAALGEFPFDQKRALDMSEQWRRMTPLERLAAQRELTAMFRSEYRMLKQAAQRKQVVTNVRK